MGSFRNSFIVLFFPLIHMNVGYEDETGLQQTCEKNVVARSKLDNALFV